MVSAFVDDRVDARPRKAFDRKSTSPAVPARPSPFLFPHSHFLFFQEGIGSLKVVPGGIELSGQAAILDALVASSLRSRRGKNLVLESWSNFTASARSHDGRQLARLTVGEKRVFFVLPSVGECCRWTRLAIRQR